MKLLSYLLLIFLNISVIAGPLGEVPLSFGSIHAYLSDLSAGAVFLFLIFIIYLQKIKIFEMKAVRYFLLFFSISLLSNIISPIPINYYERTVSLLYCFRILIYFSIYIFIKIAVQKKWITYKFFYISLLATGIILLLSGLLQYFIYPDLRNLSYLGWDPHDKRIFSSFLDPNYFGIFTVLFFIFLVYSNFLWIRSAILISLSVLTLALTYSRSSYLAFLGTGIFLILSKKKLYILPAIIIFLLGVFLLPRPMHNESVNLTRVFSITVRLDNWRQAYEIFRNNPVLGVGMNTLRYAKVKYNFLQNNWLTSHSAAGVDNSYLFLLATTGITGFLSYFIFIYKLFSIESKIFRLSLFAIIIHSIFLNTLFYPFILIWMYLICGVNEDL